ncbi:signal transduction histidine kinase [Spirochaeta africana DSM 8902]|uniref:histidine kinase n=2 Tax=Spirochaeta TaxID=146 RepID=H9UHS9_SPIAZ|nr:signal transduction histidine kinase [Spirochaeta africana DSM 8902]
MVLMLITILSVVMIAGGGFSIASVRAEGTRLVQERAGRIVLRLENALRIPLWGYNMEAAGSYILAELNDPDLVWVIVRESDDEDTLWLAYIRDRDRTHRVVTTEDGLRQHLPPAPIVQRGQIRYQQSRIGNLSIGYSDTGVRADLRRSIYQIIGWVIAMGAVIALGITLLLRIMVMRPVNRLMDRIHTITGDTGAPVNSGDEMVQLLQAFDTMIARIRHREDELQGSLAEREVLLKEVHHRVKNNFQILAGLLHLQIDTVPTEARTALQDAYQRISSMALVHEKLYESEGLQCIEFSGYLYELIGILDSATGSGRLQIIIEAEAVQLDLDTAVSLGLILNEAVANAIRHANADSLTVSAYQENGVLTVEVCDDGAGFPAEVDPATATSLGLQLIRLLSEQLRGEYYIGPRADNLSGTCARIRIPMGDAQPRQGADRE